MPDIVSISQGGLQSERKTTRKLSFDKGEVFSAKVVGKGEGTSEVILKLSDGWQFPAKVDDNSDALQEQSSKFQVIGFEDGKIKIKVVKSDIVKEDDWNNSIEELIKSSGMDLSKEDAITLKEMIKHDIPLTKENISQIKSLLIVKNKLSANENYGNELIEKYLSSKNVPADSAKGIEITQKLQKFFYELKKISNEGMLTLFENSISLNEDNLGSFNKIVDGNNVIYDAIKSIEQSMKSKDYKNINLKYIMDIINNNTAEGLPIDNKNNIKLFNATEKAVVFSENKINNLIKDFSINNTQSNKQIIQVVMTLKEDLNTQNFDDNSISNILLKNPNVNEVIKSSSLNERQVLNLLNEIKKSPVEEILSNNINLDKDIFDENTKNILKSIQQSIDNVKSSVNIYSNVSKNNTGNDFINNISFFKEIFKNTNVNPEELAGVFINSENVNREIKQNKYSQGFEKKLVEVLNDIKYNPEKAMKELNSNPSLNKVLTILKEDILLKDNNNISNAVKSTGQNITSNDFKNINPKDSVNIVNNNVIEGLSTEDKSYIKLVNSNGKPVIFDENEIDKLIKDFSINNTEDNKQVIKDVIVLKQGLNTQNLDDNNISNILLKNSNVNEAVKNSGLSEKQVLNLLNEIKYSPVEEILLNNLNLDKNIFDKNIKNILNSIQGAIKNIEDVLKPIEEPIKGIQDVLKSIEEPIKGTQDILKSIEEPIKGTQDILKPIQKSVKGIQDNDNIYSNVNKTNTINNIGFLRENKQIIQEVMILKEILNTQNFDENSISNIVLKNPNVNEAIKNSGLSEKQVLNLLNEIKNSPVEEILLNNINLDKGIFDENTKNILKSIQGEIKNIQDKGASYLNVNENNSNDNVNFFREIFKNAELKPEELAKSFINSENGKKEIEQNKFNPGFEKKLVEVLNDIKYNPEKAVKELNFNSRVNNVLAILKEDILQLKGKESLGTIVKNEISSKLDDMKNIIKSLIQEDNVVLQDLMNMYKDSLKDFKVYNDLSNKYYMVDIPVNINKDEYGCKLLIKDERKSGKGIDSKNIKIVATVKTINMGEVDSYISVNEKNMKITIKCEENWVNILTKYKNNISKSLEELGFYPIIEVSEKSQAANIVTARDFFDNSKHMGINIKV